VLAPLWITWWVLPLASYTIAKVAVWCAGEEEGE